MMLFCFGAMAQQRGGGGTPEERAKRQTDRLTEQLSLNADQEKQVLALNLERVKKMDEARAAGDNGGRDAFRASQEEYSKKLAAILTPEQQEKFKKMQAEMRQRGGGSNDQRGGEGRRQRSN